MNYIVKNGTLNLTPPLATLEEAEERAKALVMLYPNTKVERTDGQLLKEGYKLTAPPEEQEDKGCAGGACTL